MHQYALAGQLRTYSPIRQPSFSPAISMSIVRDTGSPESQLRGSSYVVNAPSGYDSQSSDEDYRESTPAFSLTGPGSDSDSDHDMGATPMRSRFLAHTSQQQRSVGVANVPWTENHTVRELNHRLQLSAAQRVLRLEEALHAVDVQEAAQLKELRDARAAQAADAADADSATAGASAVARAALLGKLQQKHQAKAAAGEYAVAEAAAQSARASKDKKSAQAAASKSAAAEQLAAAVAAADKETTKRTAAAAATAAAAVSAAATSATAVSAGQSSTVGIQLGGEPTSFLHQQQQQAPLQGAAKPVALPESAGVSHFSSALPPSMAVTASDSAPESQQAGAAIGLGGRIVVAPSAVAEKTTLEQQYSAVKAASDAFAAEKAAAGQRRQISKLIIMTVGQISASLEQVAHTSAKLITHLSSLGGGALAFAYNKLAATFLAQCDGQVVNNPRIAFPLAEVAVEVAVAHPPFLPVLLVHFHKTCQLAVPALTVFPRGTSATEEERLVALGYKVINELGASVDEKLEATSAFLKRQEACVRLYAAMTQSDCRANPHGLGHAWTYLARFLNELPGTQLTARALDAFLSVAGWKLYGSYKSQFVKLLQLVDTHFMTQLTAVDDPPLIMKLRSYYEDNCFLEVPEGRDLPRTDASSYEHNKGW